MRGTLAKKKLYIHGHQNKEGVGETINRGVKYDKKFNRWLGNKIGTVSKQNKTELNQT